MRLLLTAALALGPLVGVGGASAGPAATGPCDIRQVESLTPVVPAPPGRLRPARRVELVLRVDRATQAGQAVGSDLAAADVEVEVGLTGDGWGAYDLGTTGADGTYTAVLLLPPEARGSARLVVEAYRTLVDLPCQEVEEHGRAEGAWGRVS